MSNETSHENTPVEGPAVAGPSTHQEPPQPIEAATSAVATDSTNLKPPRVWVLDFVNGKRWGWAIVAGVVVLALVACSFILGGLFNAKATGNESDVGEQAPTAASQSSAPTSSTSPTLQAGVDKQAAGDPLGSADEIRKRQALVRKGITKGVNGLYTPIETTDPLVFAGAFAMAAYGFDTTTATADEYFTNLWQWYTPYKNAANPKWSRDALTQSQSEELQRPAYELLKSRSMVNDVVVDTAYIDQEIAGLGASQLPFPVGSSVPGGAGSHLVVVALDVQAFSTEKQAPQDKMPVISSRQQKIVQMIVLCPGFAGFTGSSCKAVYESSSPDAWYTNLEKQWIFHS